MSPSGNSLVFKQQEKGVVHTLCISREQLTLQYKIMIKKYKKI